MRVKGKKAAAESVANTLQSKAPVQVITAEEIARSGAKDDPAIPNLNPGIQTVIAQLLPVLEPGLDRTLHGDDAFKWPSGVAPIDQAVALHFEPNRFPPQIDIRALNAVPAGEYNEGQYLLDVYLRECGDANITTTLLAQGICGIA